MPGSKIAGYVIDVSKDDAEPRLEKLLANVIASNGGSLLDHIVYTTAVFDLKPVGIITVDWLGGEHNLWCSISVDNRLGLCTVEENRKRMSRDMAETLYLGKKHVTQNG